MHRSPASCGAQSYHASAARRSRVLYRFWTARKRFLAELQPPPRRLVSLGRSQRPSARRSPDEPPRQHHRLCASPECARRARLPGRRAAHAGQAPPDRRSGAVEAPSEGSAARAAPSARSSPARTPSRASASRAAGSRRSGKPRRRGRGRSKSASQPLPAHDVNARERSGTPLALACAVRNGEAS